MLKHEEKLCPRCKANFECKVGSVGLCQCSKVKLNDHQRSHLQENFTDCLCANCMKEMRTEYNVQQFKNRIRTLLLGRG